MISRMKGFGKKKKIIDEYKNSFQTKYAILCMIAWSPQSILCNFSRNTKQRRAELQ